MDVVLRLLVGVAAAWITAGPMPQQGHPSSYEERATTDRVRLRVVR